MLINQAEKVYLGNQEAQKVYLGSQLVWELPSEPDVSEATFTLTGEHSDKPKDIPFITIGKNNFTNFGVDPTTVTAVTVNGERHDVTKVEMKLSTVYFHIENADSLELDGSETLTIHYRA